MAKKGDIILKEIYPHISTQISKNKSKYKQCLSRFIDKRSESLYAIAPYDRIFYGIEDLEDYWKSTGIDPDKVQKSIDKTYYGDIANFNPRAAKDPLVVSQLCVVRYYLLNHSQKELDLSCIYLSLTGKMYPSIHSGSFPKVVPREYPHVMDYCINNVLTNKYDIKREGSVFKTLNSITQTWIATYKDRFKSFEDDDVVYLIQQIHDRIKSFMVNIAKVYYTVYADKDRYLAYDSDNLGEDNYRLADNDSLKIEREVESSVNYFNTTATNYAFCKIASDKNVKTDEIKMIIDSIMSDNKNMDECKELCRCMIAQYYTESKTKDVRDIDFINKTLSPKSNSKNPNVVRQKEIIEGWLSENSPAYLRRKSREATKNSYFRAISTYFVLAIQKANK